ncbi:hypothetical protein [Spirosoma aerolatum]|uniref:hypothetical protein n=1 Tax=Spirosoma aerolatum TaxID=1211326 RepID=UPI0009AEEA6E|nr:hypothetical protein [Spirosoma aerolatum]
MKGKLKHGDQARIAEITGFTHDYVKKVMQGIRHNKKILEVAEQMVAIREQLSQENNRQEVL